MSRAQVIRNRRRVASLRALPKGSLGREHARFMESEELSIERFAKASLASMDADDYADPRACCPSRWRGCASGPRLPTTNRSCY
jgi:hypothetical protein